jgi:hypothetical protein
MGQVSVLCFHDVFCDVDCDILLRSSSLAFVHSTGGFQRNVKKTRYETPSLWELASCDADCVDIGKRLENDRSSSMHAGYIVLCSSALHPYTHTQTCFRLV